MAEYKQVDLQIGTEAQFENKKETLPIGTIVGITDPIHKSELDSSLQTSIDSIANKLNKPSSNPTEYSVVTLTPTGEVGTKPLSELGEVTVNLYRHNIKFASEENINIYGIQYISSKSFIVDSLTDLTTLITDNNPIPVMVIKSATYRANAYLNPQNTTIYFQSGSSPTFDSTSLSSYTITDVVTVV